MQIVSYGGGTNSVAILVGLWERGESVDAITFSDTGDEKPYTYGHIWTMAQWCVDHGLPPITILRGSQPQQVKDGSLSAECLRLGVLPSKAYGFGSCSDKWKLEPARRFDRALAAGFGIAVSEITRLIGFDADEPFRVERALRLQKPELPRQRFPLVEWDWGREECIVAIQRAGLPLPGKSACHMCPSSKKHEVLALRQDYPHLFALDLEMERRAIAGEGQAPALRAKGLGRTFSWAAFVKEYDAQTELDQRQMCLFSNAGVPEQDCGCYDGDG